MIGVSEEQRQAIHRHGTPLAMIDQTSGEPYLLLKVQLSPAPLDGVRARIEGLDVIGEGEDPEDALIALRIALTALP